MLSILYAAQDLRITTQEIEEIVLGVLMSAAVGMVMVASTKLFIKAVQSDHKEAKDLISIAEKF